MKRPNKILFHFEIISISFYNAIEILPKMMGSLKNIICDPIFINMGCEL